MNTLDILVIGFILLVVLLKSLISYLIAKKRTERFKDIALNRGLLFEDDAQTLKDELQSGRICFSFFKQGSSSQPENCLCGVRFGRFSADFFDYSYIDSGSRHSRKYNYRCGLVRFPSEICLPQFELVPEYFFMRLRDSIFGLDIDFDEHPLFSEKYQLTAYRDSEESYRLAQEEYIRKLFQPSVIACFEKYTGLEAYSKANFLLVCKYGLMKIEETEEFENAVREISEIIYSAYQSNLEYFRSMQA